jgi:hypothetical protein
MLLRVLSSGIRRHVVHRKLTDVSEEDVDSVSRIEEYVKQETSIKHVIN